VIKPVELFDPFELALEFVEVERLRVLGADGGVEGDDGDH